MKTSTSAVIVLAGAIGIGLSSGCGGGGGSGPGAAPAPASTTRTRGNIVSVDGDSSAVSGVELTASGSGASATSDARGSFDLGRLPAGPTTIRIALPSAVKARDCGDDDGEDDRGKDDGMEVEVELEGGGEARLHITIEDGVVTRLSMDRSCGDDASMNGTTGPLMGSGDVPEGEVSLETHEGGEQELEVEAEHLPPGDEVELVLVDLAGQAEAIGRRVVDEDGKARVKLRTEDGDALPHGVDDLADLEDFQVLIRDASSGEVILSGTVPTTGEVPVCRDDDDDGDDDDDDDNDDEPQRKGEGWLTPTAGVSGAAQVELRSRPERGEEKIEVHVAGVDAAGGLDVWLEDPAEEGALHAVGAIVPEDDGLEFERDTRDGGTLPYGSPDAVGLVGLSVEVRRRSDGAVLFRGVTPPLNRS